MYFLSCELCAYILFFVFFWLLLFLLFNYISEINPEAVIMIQIFSSSLCSSFDFVRSSVMQTPWQHFLKVRSLIFIFWLLRFLFCLTPSLFQANFPCRYLILKLLWLVFDKQLKFLFSLGIYFLRWCAERGI